MDPFKLLSRSSKLSRSKQQGIHTNTPSSGQNAQPQLFGELAQSHIAGSRKRKRGEDERSIQQENGETIDFFGKKNGGDIASKTQQSSRGTEREPATAISEDEEPQPDELEHEERKKILKQHKLKTTWLNSPLPSKKERRKAKAAGQSPSKSKPPLFPNPLQSFDQLGPRFRVSRRLSSNVIDQGFSIPTEVQLAALPLLLDESTAYLPDTDANSQQDRGQINLLTVAPTGSGKTLAYMIPLLQRIQSRKRKEPKEGRRCSAIVLAPTKELAGQIVNEGKKLAKDTGITISQMRKGMLLESDKISAEGEDAKKGGTVVKADILVSTPGLLQSSLEDQQELGLVGVQHLILDEADVLLDPLFRQQTFDIWNSLSSPSLQLSMWSATIGSNIEDLASATIDERHRRLVSENNATIPVMPLIRLVVGLKDSAVPNVQHKLTYAATEQGKLMGLRQLLHPSTSAVDPGPSLRPPFLVFTQTIERAVALHAELLYDIPAEAGGIGRIAVLHSDLSDTARYSIMTRFRKGEIWVLITTDLLSRGVDFRGVNGVVNYDIPTSSAAYVHRVGRTGRAGREGGVAVTLYSKEDIPYLKPVANVVAMAQKGKGDEEGMQQWLLDAIPKLSKNEKQNLKKHGVESRTARGRQNDPKASRKARISTKAGFVRKQEGNRKGAIRGSQRRAQLEQVEDEGDETDFGGFD